MKNYLCLLAALLSACVFGSCSSENEDNDGDRQAVNVQNLAGTWLLTNKIGYDQNHSQFTITDFEDMDAHIFTFKGDMTFKGYRMEATQLQRADKLKKGNFVLADSSLQVIGNGLTLPLHIKSISRETMLCTHTDNGTTLTWQLVRCKEVKDIEGLAGTWQLDSITGTDPNGQKVDIRDARELDAKAVFALQFGTDNTFKGYRMGSYNEATGKYNLLPSATYPAGDVLSTTNHNLHLVAGDDVLSFAYVGCSDSKLILNVKNGKLRWNYSKTGN